MPEIILLTNARNSFPHLVEPQSTVDQATGKTRISYSIDLILTPDSPSFKSFMQEVQKLALAKWGENAGAVLQMVQSDRKTRCFGSGNEKIDKKTFKPFKGYENQLYITAIKDRPPQIIGTDGNAVEDGNTMAYQMLTRKMYAGCYVNAAVRPWLQDNKFGRGIRCELIAVQFAADGEAFGEGDADASSLFGAVAAPASAAPTPSGAPAPFGVPNGLPSFFN